MSNINEVNWVELGLFVSGCLASIGAILKISQGSKCNNIKICWGLIDCSRKPEINNNIEINNNENENKNDQV